MKQLFRLLVLAVLLLGTLSPTVTHTVQAQTISSDTDFADNSLALTREQVQSFDCATVTDIPLGECQALVTLYNSTNGAGWTDNTNWLVTTTAGGWFGVTVSSGHVQVLSLLTNGLTGSIPPELGHLTNLQILSLGFNQLTGSIPPELGNLTYLEDLNLCGNQFGNQLTGSIPPELGNLTNLQNFYLEFNQLTGSIPPELGNLTNLQRLYLYGNQLTGSIPPELGNLTNLYYLYLNDNQLTGSIPTELGNLTNLTWLSLWSNQLTGSIPPELGNLNTLLRLDLGGNQLTGSIPPELGNLNTLLSLGLGGNQLTGSIPPELGNLTNLEDLQLYNNQLTGSIPSELGNLTNLQRLYLYENQLTGSIPPELGNLTNLVDLDLDNNQLAGGIPPELGNLTNLYYLYLNDNQLTGSIPTELGNLIILYCLGLDNNQLSGEVPASFVNLVNLYDAGTGTRYYDGLDLDYNALTVPAGYPVAGNPLHDFLLSKDPNWHLRQTIEEVVGSSGGEMTSLDGTVNIIVPPGAVGDNTTFTFTPQRGPNFNIGKLAFAHNSFLLTAVDGLGNPVTVFAQPVSMTITYDKVTLGLLEESLKLYYWDATTTTWVDAVTTCDPVGEYTRNLEGNTFSLEICHLSEFAVLGDAPRIFLPTVLR